MKFKSTTKIYYMEDGTPFYPYTGGPEPVTDGVWRPLHEVQRKHLERSNTGRSGVSDFVPPVGDLSQYKECRLKTLGDAFTASVWEVR